jgi:hypothetical protein
MKAMHSPSALTSLLACQHLAALRRAHPAATTTDNAEVDHPAEGRRTQARRPRGIGWPGAARSPRSSAGAGSKLPSETAESARVLVDRVDVVNQGVFVHDGWRGIADFLERQPDGSYEAADTKLAPSSKRLQILQLRSTPSSSRG